MTGSEQTEEQRIAELEQQIRELRRTRFEERQKVVKIAQKYAGQHNLCEVVDRALSEAGLFGGEKSYDVSLVVRATARIGLNEDLVADMEEDELTKWVGDQAKVKRMELDSSLGIITGVSYGNVKRVNPDVRVEGLEVVEVVESTLPSLGTEESGIPAFANGRYYARYTSSMGRVLHVVELYHSDCLKTTAVCGKHNTYGAYTVSPEHGFEQRWSQYSNQAYRSLNGEAAYCRQCADYVEMQYGHVLPVRRF